LYVFFLPTFSVTKEAIKEERKKREEDNKERGRSNEERSKIMNLPFSCVKTELVRMRAMLPVHLEFNPVASSTDAAPAASDAIATDASGYTREASL
jgi:hypothetical protein